MANPIGKVIEKEGLSAAHSLYRSAIQGLSDILDSGTTKDLRAGIKKVVAEFKAHGITKDIVTQDATDFGTRKIELPVAAAAPAKVFKQTAKHVQGGKSEGAILADYHKSLTLFDKMSTAEDANPEVIADEIDLMSRKYGKTPQQMENDLMALKQRGEKVGASVYTPASKADELRSSAISSGVPEATANRFTYEEGKYERYAMNMGTEAGNPAKTRSYRVGIKLTKEERAAMGKSKMWERTAAEEPVGTSKEVGAPEVYYVFAKTPEDASKELAKVMSEVHADMGAKGKGAKVADPKLAIPKKEKEVKPESTPIEETPKKPVPDTKVAEVDGDTLQKELDGIPDTPVNPAKEQDLSPEAVRAKLEGNGKDAGFIGGKNATDLSPEEVVVPKELLPDDMGVSDGFTPQYKNGAGRKIAAGVLGAGAVTGGALMMSKPDVTESSTSPAGTEAPPTAKDESKRRLGDVVTGSTEPTPKPAEADVVDTVKTKGGDYNVYKKDSAMAQSFRDAYKAAKGSGAKVFNWNGLKYKVA
jgi:hypothetical protein